MAKTYLYYISILCFVLLASCSSHDQETDPQTRTILVYMAANDLSSDQQNIELMKKGMKGCDGNWIIYLDKPSGAQLLRLKSKQGVVEMVMIKAYGQENSASSATLTRVIRETKELFPADSYGLICWSHGTGWLPAQNPFFRSRSLLKRTATSSATEEIRTRSFALDNGGSVIEIPDMASAIEDKFDFIIFDVCFMSSIEVMYELREKCDYIIASPAEVLDMQEYNAAGLPYDKIVPLLFKNEADLKEVCRQYYEHYNTLPDTKYRSATITLVKTSELTPLFDMTKDILQGKEAQIAALNLKAIQFYDLFNPPVFSDFGDYIKQLATTSEYQAFSDQLNKTVIYKASTQRVWTTSGQIAQIEVNPDKYSGVTVYIPRIGGTMNDYYSVLEWGGMYNIEAFK